SGLFAPRHRGAGLRPQLRPGRRARDRGRPAGARSAARRPDPPRTGAQRAAHPHHDGLSSRRTAWVSRRLVKRKEAVVMTPIMNTKDFADFGAPDLVYVR